MSRKVMERVRRKVLAVDVQAKQVGEYLLELWYYRGMHSILKSELVG